MVGYPEATMLSMETPACAVSVAAGLRTFDISAWEVLLSHYLLEMLRNMFGSYGRVMVS